MRLFRIVRYPLQEIFSYVAKDEKGIALFIFAPVLLLKDFSFSLIRRINVPCGTLFVVSLKTGKEGCALPQFRCQVCLLQADHPAEEGRSYQEVYRIIGAIDAMPIIF
jgi:hypothetical protein